MIDISDQMKAGYPDVCKYLDLKKKAEVEFEATKRNLRQAYNKAQVSIGDDCSKLNDAKVRESFLEILANDLLESAKADNPSRNIDKNDVIEIERFMRGYVGTTRKELYEILGQNRANFTFETFENRYMRSFMRNVTEDILGAPASVISESHVDQILDFTKLREARYIRREFIRKPQALELLNIYSEYDVVSPKMIDGKDYYNPAGAGYFNNGGLIMPTTEQVTQINRDGRA